MHRSLSYHTLPLLGVAAVSLVSAVSAQTLVISNLDQPQTTSATITDPAARRAMKFTAGNTDAVLTYLSLLSDSLGFGPGADAYIQMELHADNNGLPGNLVATYFPYQQYYGYKDTIDLNMGPTVTLKAHTTYWLTTGPVDVKYERGWLRTTSTAATGLPGWSLGTSSATSSDGVTWTASPDIYMMSVTATELPPNLQTWGNTQEITNTVENPQNLTAFDMDGDGDLDLIATQAGNYNVRWWENLGGGKFRRAGEWFPYRSQQTYSAIADFNHDGKVDLLATYYNGGDNTFYDQLFTGSGLNGGFTLQGSAFPVGTPDLHGQINQIVQDLDGDGAPEILSPTGTWLNNSSGSFTTHVASGLPDTVFSAPAKARAWVDANGDGRPDLFFASGASLYRFLNQGDGTFAAGEILATLDPSATEVFDSLTATPAGSPLPQVALIAARRNPNWDVASGLSLYTSPTAGAPYQLSSVVKLDPDKNQQIVSQFLTTRTGAKSRFFVDFSDPLPVRNGVPDNRGLVMEATIRPGKKPALTLKQSFVHPGISTATLLADLTGDSIPDAVLPLNHIGATNAASNQPFVSQIAFYPATRTGFSKTLTEVTNPATDGYAVFAGDLDGDGAPDILTQASGEPNQYIPNGVALWHNSGHGESFRRESLLARGTYNGVVAVADRNKDGRKDILTFCSTRDPNTGLYTDELIQFNALGNGKFRQQILLRLTKSGLWSTVELIDGDQDGYPDLRINGSLWLKGSKTGRFPTKIPTVPTPGFPAAGQTLVDVDWDGDMDYWDEAAGTWLENTGKTTPWISHPGPFVRFDTIAPTLDLDGDGHPDYVQHGYNDYVTALIARGDAGKDSGYYPISTTLPQLALLKPVSWVDIDGDGDLDPVYPADPGQHSGTFEIRYRVNTSPGFQISAEQRVAVAGAYSRDQMLAADLNGDGVQDLISASLSVHRIEWFPGIASH
ncbi:MAG: C-terminal target protein [Akkermansiaceae bacterium]|nr:C-terminal target protein [Akkermansiaceae bacterium]